YLRALSLLESQAQQAKEASGTDRDQKLRDLEQKIDAMLKELHSLRGQNTPPTAATAPTAGYPRVPPPSHQGTTAAVPVAAAASNYYWLTANVPGSSDVTVLTRANYKMPAAKAEALGAFLTQNV